MPRVSPDRQPLFPDLPPAQKRSRTRAPARERAVLPPPAPEDLPPTRLKVLVGTSGYSFADWVGPFYPRGTRPSEMLDHYIRHFPAVEINATYYRVPRPATFERMEARTPPDFRFYVKLHQDMTHKKSRDPARYLEFLRAVEPLSRNGKLKGLLAQFPYGFRYNPESLVHLEYLKGALPGHSLHVEFRRSEWDQPAVDGFLSERGIGYCCVDEPLLGGLLKPRALATSEIGYVRFHGRNAENWWGGPGDRYDYRYSEPELHEWLGRIRELAERSRQVYVFFNNCHAGHAASNAMRMQQLLLKEGIS